MNNKYDLIVVGGGVLGTFHALFASRKGSKVLLLEKDSQPRGATVQNFGMIATGSISEPGIWESFARRSNRIYRELDETYDFTLRKNGTLYLVETEWENQVISEFADLRKHEDDAPQYLDRTLLLKEFDFINESYLAGGLFLPGDMSIEPNQMIAKLQKQLTDEGVFQVQYNAPVTSIEDNCQGVMLTLANQKQYEASKAIICNGTEFQLLYPELFAQSEMQVCVLHMMRTAIQQNLIIPHNILSGLSVAHYPGFSICPGFKKLKDQLDNTIYNEHGIHVLFKNNLDGTVTIGDSHHYYPVKDKSTIPYEIDMTINQMILNYAQKMLKLPHWNIQNFWLGKYMTNPEGPIFEAKASDNVFIRTGISGKGLSTAPGYSEDSINHILS